MTATVGPARSPTVPALSERLADHVVGLRYEDIPDAAIEKAKHHFAYLLGSALRGQSRACGPLAVRAAAALSGDGGDCTVVGHTRKANLVEAVFANSYLVTCTGLDDFLLPEGVHPGAVAYPVAWAFGERTGAPGRELLTAVVAGYDVMGRLCDPALTWGLEVFRPAEFVFEPLAAAAIAARMLGLSHEQTVHALGYAAQVGRHIAGEGNQRSLMHPLLARNGATGAVLAKVGMTASPTVIEGEHGLLQLFFGSDLPGHVSNAMTSLGREFTIAAAQTRRDGPVPLSGHNIVPVELTRRLVDEHGVAAGQVAAVEVTLPRSRQTREERREQAVLRPEADQATRLSSLGLRVAMVVAGGPIDPDRFTRPPDADLLAVREKVRLRFEPDRPFLYARVEITTTDGDRYVAEDENLVPPPLDWVEWLTVGGRDVLPEAQLARLVDLIDHLEDVADVSEVMACVVPPGPVSEP